jgi:dihydrofolate reductase
MIHDKKSRKVILFIAMSLDGFIATKSDDLSFLDRMAKEGEDYGYGAFTETVDTVILGRRTFEKVASMGYDNPHAERNCYVVTRRPEPDQGNTRFYTGDLAELVSRLKSEEGKHIFVDGGAWVVQEMLNSRLLDEIILSVIPVLLGDGIRLFRENSPEQELKLLEVKSFEKGLVQLHYQVERP